jgi:acyl-CoA reductase-like NAD-dependent aldehyde dehydrogenase
MSVKQRLRIVHTCRHRIADEAQALAEAAHHIGRSASDSLASEVMPLLDALRYLEKRAASLLKPARRRRHRPLWLFGKTLRVERAPHGVVLIVAPSNYKLMLGGIQAMQALVAGNGVLLKPGRDALPVMRRLKHLANEAGVPRGLFQCLPEAPEAAHRAIVDGVDHVVFTGSNNAGRAVHQTAAAFATPVTMELSGCDAAFVVHDADPVYAGKALAYGLCFNGGDTCVSPRRVFVEAPLADALIDALLDSLSQLPPLELEGDQADHMHRKVHDLTQRGGRLVSRAPSGHVDQPMVVDCGRHAPAMLNAPTPLPILTVRRYTDPNRALREANACPYGLAASVFTSAPQRTASLVGGIEAGTIFINDLILPIADPRLPFEARGQSGFGVTRGPEGLLAMTRARAVCQSRWADLYWQLLPPWMQAPINDAIVLRHGHGFKARMQAGWRCLQHLTKGTFTTNAKQ